MQKYVDILEDWDDIVCDSWEISPEKYLDPTSFLDYYSNDLKIQKMKNIIRLGFQKMEGFIHNKFTKFLTIYNENQ